MSVSLSAFPPVRPYKPVGWAIYAAHGLVEKYINLVPDDLQFTQDVASFICAKTNLPLCRITARGNAHRFVRMRQYFTYIAREEKQFSFPHIGKILGRDHTTIMNNYRKISHEISTRPHGKSASDVRWITEKYYSLQERENRQ